MHFPRSTPIQREISWDENSSLVAKPHHKSFSQNEIPQGGMRGGSFAGSYLSPRTGALRGGAQGKPSSRNNLSGAASLGLFPPPGTGYISWEAGRARKVIPEKAPEGAAAGSTEGGVAFVLCDICVWSLSSFPPATLPGLPEALPPPPSLLPLGKVLTGVEKKPRILPNKAGLIAFLPSH